MSSSFQTWAATGVATIASTYLLDLLSAGAGALLVASGLLHGVGVGAASAFLAASYLVWAGALRPSLAANWDLLQQTGGSTCLPSKIAHDLALRRRTGERTRRIAAALGYVGAEIAKEAPYYLGAVGLMLFADGMGPDDALIFLGGANLGAAAYEYGLAWGTRRLLAHAPATGEEPGRGLRTTSAPNGRISSARSARRRARAPGWSCLGATPPRWPPTSPRSARPSIRAPMPC